ncbi:MAG: hypothetical protein ABL940_13820 [Bacteroidia bacterium]
MNTTVFDKDWVELVFEGRNQNYGAYVIRKNQGNNMLWGVFITLGIGVVAIAVPRIIMALSDAPIVEQVIKNDDVIKIISCKIEDVVIEKTQPAVAPKATKVEAPPIIVVDKDVKKVLPPILPATLPPENGNTTGGSPTGTGLLPTTGSGEECP